MHIDLHTAGRPAFENASQVWADRALASHIDGHDLSELSFEELLDLQDKSSEDNSVHTYNDCAIELRDRRLEARAALIRLFTEQVKVGGEVPMVEGGKVVAWPMHRYLCETVACDEWASMTADLLMGATSRDRLIKAIAEEYVKVQSEDLLRAGWTQ